MEKFEYPWAANEAKKVLVSFMPFPVYSISGLLSYSALRHVPSSPL